MKLIGHKLQTDYTPLNVGGNLHITGGTGVQFYDGENYLPDRAGTPGSPIIISHELTFVDPDGILTEFEYSTLFYENDVLITEGTPGYELIDDNELKVTKNIAGGTAVTIKAVSELLDTRNNKVYKREDITYLRTFIKAESPHQLELTPSGRQFFDGYRNPNTKTDITATLNINGEDITDYTGVTFKWLNSENKDCVENELYGDEYKNDNRTFTIDKTYIDREKITCEAWINDKLVASDSVTFVRRFNSYRSEVRIPELPITSNTTVLNCSVHIYDTIGKVDVDAAFLVTWFVKEGANEREVGSGSVIQVPVESLSLNAINLQIYPDLKRREAWAALVTDDDSILVLDDDETVITTETYGN